MKNYILASVVILGIIAISGCIGNYGYADVDKNLSGFNQIIISGGGPNDIIITQGDKESVEVSSGKSAVDDIKAEVINKKLYLNSPHPVTYYITVKDINYIEMKGPGPGQLDATNLKLNNLSIKINNGVGSLSNLTINNLKLNGDFYAGNLTTTNLIINSSYCNITNLNANNIILNGSGIISGKAANQKVNVTGIYNATNLISEAASIYINGPGNAYVTSKTATISINGPGEATVRVSDLLNVIIYGPGDLYYIGKPKITKKITGWGTVTQIPG